MNHDKIGRLGQGEHAGQYPYIRPKDAATLLILRRSGQGIQVLMGRRHMRHTFMPGKLVFPGGRVDPADSRLKTVPSYHPDVEAKLSQHLKKVKSAARVRAFALAAIRETYEEAGLFIGRKVSGGKPIPLTGGFDAFAERAILPDLSPMRMIARAITPPQRPRRFDTRFLAVWSDAIAGELPTGTGPSGELEELAWLTLEEARQKDLPAITNTVLSDLETRLETDPDLDPATPVPFYYFKGKGFIRDLI